MVVDNREKVIDLIKKVGPVLPIQIAKRLETDLLLSGAILSEMIARKQLKVSRATIGSSPVYYIPGQEYLLGPKLYNHLKSKEREAYDALRDKKIIRSEKAEPWQRIAFSQLHDFAMPMYVTIKDKTEIFWRFYLVSEEEAKEIIGEILQSKKREKSDEPEPEQLTLPVVNEEIKETPKEAEKQVEPIKEIKKPRKPRAKPLNNFYESIIEYLNKNKIKILEDNIIRKNKEYEFIADLPTTIGNLKYFVKAKNKKSITDAEITMAHSQGQEKRYPCLFITNGNLNKKAKELIEKKISGQLIFKQI